MSEKILITSALPYANGPIHFGHIAGAYLPGDVYARFQRLKGNDVLYICGSDEYGFPIALSAELAKRTPKEHVDLFHKINKNFFDQLNFSFDHYSRTTCDGHQETVQAFFLDLLQDGYIEEKEEDHLYSEKENRFFADRYVVGICPKCSYENARGDECPKCGASYEATDLKNPKSKLTNNPLILKKSTHWYLRFDLFKEKLEKWIKNKSWKPNVIHFAKSYIKELRPRAITRDSSWGVPVPLKEAKGKVLYVWFDAPIGYISASKEWAQKKGDPELWKKYWFNEDTKFVNFIGKDNIPFHAVFFPAMIMGQKKPYKLVDEIPANEFYLLEGKQFSKSEGWYIDLESFFEKYTADQIRYTIAANAPETSDSDFSWKDFQMRCNSELLGKIGNLVHRALVFAHNHSAGKVPLLSDLEKSDEDFKENALLILQKIHNEYDQFSLRKAVMGIVELAQLANTYFDHKKPWLLAKDPDKKQELHVVIYLILNCIKNLALVSSPILVESAQKIWNFLGYKTRISEENWEKVLGEDLPTGQTLQKSEVLFKKIEDSEVEEEIIKLGAFKRSSNYPALKESITFDQFQHLDLRVACILQAEKVPKSKKLLKLEVDIGLEKRVVVSGISEYYEPEDLVNKKVIFVANLKPAKIMGIESQGMILAASLDKDLELPFIEKMEVGSIVS